MNTVLRTVSFVALAVALVGCANLDNLAQTQTATVGNNQIVVDAAGNEIQLPDSLPQQAYVGEDADLGVPVQNAYWTGPALAPTPIGHPNAEVYYTSQAYSSFRTGDAIFIFVGKSSDPEGRAAVIPGSLWWPTAGIAEDTAIVPASLEATGQQQRFLDELAVITGNNPSEQIVFYCDEPNCWAPYNAALRLRDAGYSNVAWYRGGTGAWYAANLPLEIAAAPDWNG